MANHSLPTLTSTYVDFVQEVNDKIKDNSLCLDPAYTTVTNQDIHTIRYSSSAGKWQKWDGLVWNDLNNSYNINISGTAGGVDWNNVSNKPTNIVTNNAATYNISISGNAATATTATSASTADSVNWNNVSNKPTNIVTNNGGTYNINISGRGYPYRSDGTALNFYWSGQSGQPPWLWGGSDGSNMYVYNPSNFSVNYANSAGSANSVAWGNVSGKPSLVYNDGGTYSINTTGTAGGVAWSNVSGRPSGLVLVGSADTGYIGDGSYGVRTVNVPVSSQGLYHVEVDVNYFVAYGGNFSGTCIWSFASSSTTAYSPFVVRGSTVTTPYVQVKIYNTYEGAQIWPHTFYVRVYKAG